MEVFGPFAFLIETFGPCEIIVLLLIIGAILIARASRSKTSIRTYSNFPMFDMIFKAIFFLVRIPIFFLCIFLWSCIVPFMIGYALLVVPVLGFPFAFLSGVFSNSPKEFAEKIGDVCTAISDILGSAFRPYGSMFLWLLGIQRRRW